MKSYNIHDLNQFDIDVWWNKNAESFGSTVSAKESAIWGLSDGNSMNNYGGGGNGGSGESGNAFVGPGAGVSIGSDNTYIVQVNGPPLYWDL